MDSLNLNSLLPFFVGLFLGLMAMAVHEAAHIVAAWALGIKIKSVGFSWKGVYTVREAGPPVKNLFVSFAGPLINLLLMLLWPWSPMFGLANLCFGVCNLLPIRGSDGDRMLSIWNEMRKAALLAETASTVKPEERRRAA